jgi:hypothetical protein
MEIDTVGNNAPSGAVLKEETNPFFTGVKDESMRRAAGCFLDTSLPLPQPSPVRLFLNGAEVCTNEILCITGQAKSLKSWLATGVLAAVVVAVPGKAVPVGAEGEVVVDALGWRVAPGAAVGRVVVWIDTEQDVGRAAAKVIATTEKRTGLKMDENVVWFCSVKKWLARIDKGTARVEVLKGVLGNVLERCKRTGKGVFCIVIDGVASFVKSVNDEQEAIEIVHDLNHVTDIFDCPLLAVIHENQGQAGRLRGHLGSTVTRAAETVVFIKKEAKTGIATVSLRGVSRGEDMKDFNIRFDKEKGFPVTTKERPKKGKNETWNEEGEEKKSTNKNWLLAREIFKGGKRIRVGAGKGGNKEEGLIAIICSKTKCKKGAAESKIRRMRASGFIRQEKIGKEMFWELGKA